MARRIWSIAIVLAVAFALPAAATGHPGLPGSVAPSGEPPSEEAEEPSFDRKSDNINLVEHVQFPQASDMFFQRRDGRQIVDGRRVVGERDYLFVGADVTLFGEPPEGTPIGFRTYDITDPTAPVELTVVECSGLHSDVAVYESLLVQGLLNEGEACPSAVDPNGVDRTNPDDEIDQAGVRIFDIADPARPILLAHLIRDDLGTGAHHVIPLPWAGLLYVAGSKLDNFDVNADPGEPLISGDDFVLPVIDLKDPSFPTKVIPMREITPHATAECHDIGLAQMEDRDLAFCPAIEQTFIWDISDPLNPEHISNVVGLPETVHHAARLAPDGKTLVLGDELAAALGPGCAPTTADPLGGLYFYDISVPEVPVYRGVFSTSETRAEVLCTSHMYNFIPGTTLLTIGWYKSGMIVVDYENPAVPTEHAVFTPSGGNFFSAFYWHGYVYGSSFGATEFGADASFDAGGVWITRVDGVGDVEPSPFDEGVMWAPWTPPSPGRADAVR